MEYNPYDLECNRLQRALESKNGDKDRLSDTLSWYDAIDINSLNSSLASKESSQNELQSLINDIEREANSLLTKIQTTKSHIKTLLNPSNWFNDEQKSYRQKAYVLKTALRKKKEHIRKQKNLSSETDISIKTISKDIEKHQNIDRQEVSEQIGSLSLEIAILGEKFNRTSGLKANVDVVLQPVIKQINDYEFSISAAKEKIGKAKSFERKLDFAANSYQRAIIHNECEDSLGAGSPKKVIGQEERSIKKFERDLVKSRNRAVKIGETFSRDIRKIIIDGNNMCYEGNQFVGLSPLIESCIELQKRYKIIIVFDSAIRSQVKAGDQEIREQFGSGTTVHIVASKQLADETILDIASSDSFYYILSNDRFGEYTEKDVVKDCRLIRHEIVDSKVIIHDLNVNVRYG